MVNQSVGYDAGKKITGRKRFMTVDTLGLVLRVLVSATNLRDHRWYNLIDVNSSV